MFPLTTDGTDIFSLLLPVIMCCLVMSLMGRGQQPSTSPIVETDEWFVPFEIQKAFDVINEEAMNWKQKAKKIKPSTISRISNMFYRRSEKERFVIEQSISPRLIRLNDSYEGKITFELTKADEVGTSVKVTYGSRARDRIKTFRAQMPVKVPPPPPRENICKSCGRPIQPEFVACPYCGEKLS